MSNKINTKEKSMSGKNIIIFFLVGAIVILGGILVFNNIKNTPSGDIQNTLSSNIPNEPSGNIQNKPSNNIPNQSLLQPKLVVSEEEWDFGIVKPNVEPISHIFIVKNEGEGELIIGELRKSCLRLEASISNSKIQPGESAELKVSFNTIYKGAIEKGSHPTNLVIYSNDAQVPNKRINLDVYVKEL